MDKQKVLFVCIHNSARSQMAEAFLKQLGDDRFEAFSAGLEPGTLNPVVVHAMREIGIDISGNATKSVFDFYKRGERFSYVVAVCDAEAAERCPIFPGVHKNLHWGLPDPSTIQGSPEEKLEGALRIRDMVKAKVEEFIREYGRR